MEPSLSTELAIRAFDADAALSAALAEFQKGPREESLVADARRAAEHGFAWYARPSEVAAFQVVLCHKGGAMTNADGQSISALLAGLLGHPLAHDVVTLAAQASEPEPRDLAVEAFNADPAFARINCIPDTAAPSPAQAAAESLAAATGGAGAIGPSEYVPDPDETERQRLAVPLTDEQKAVCIEMIKVLSADQRKAFTIAFRDAFLVPRQAKSIAPLITEVRHMEFCDRWSIEAAGGVAP
jgi:hypothetical protein